MSIFKTISFFALAISIFVISSCSTKYPTPQNPNNGLVVLSYYASNTSRLDFYRYYKIFPSTNPEIVIKIFPQRGQNYAFSNELPSGIYNFDRIKLLLNSSVARSTIHSGVEEIKGGINVEVKPGLITPADKKLYIEQYNMQGTTSVTIKKYFQLIPESEMNELRLKYQ